MAAPHFAYPFRITGAVPVAATVPQDSSREVAQCVFAILGTRPGSRERFPDLGIEDPTFEGLDLDDVRAQIEDYEPRAEIVADSDLADLIQRVRLSVALR